MENQKINNILNYIKLDINNVPESLVVDDIIDINTSDLVNEKNYKVYQYVHIKDINILVTDSRRIDDPSKKIEKIKPLSEYFNAGNKDDYDKMLELFQNSDISEIEEIEKTQNEFKKNIPAKIKFSKDYLWQIYYINKTNKYYMILPLQETENSAFLYLLKEKINNTDECIYVPICNLKNSSSIIDSSKISTLENNLNFLTKKWPHIFEVYNLDKSISLYVIGEFEVFNSIISSYKMEFDNQAEITELYELTKKLFYIQTEVSNYFEIDKVIDENGCLHFYVNNNEITNSNFNDFCKNEIDQTIKSIANVKKMQCKLEKSYKSLKEEETRLNAQLLIKQKQISTFLECKKTFFGRMKYFFKYKKNKEEKIVNKNEAKEKQEETNKETEINYIYDIEDLVYVCKNLNTETTKAATIRLDVQSLKIKIDILKKKLENATKYIQEIESHKKSIFEFWKFTNKDETNQLTEGITKIQNDQKIERNFVFNDNFDEFGKYIDLEQRKKLSFDELNALFITSLTAHSNLNITSMSKEQFLEYSEQGQKKIDFESISHREKSRRLEEIVNIANDTANKDVVQIFKNTLSNLEHAFKKCKTNINMSVYSLVEPINRVMEFEINPSKLEIKDEKTMLYKINIPTGTNFLAYSNIVFFHNRNGTLPLGMDYSSKILLDLRKKTLIKINTKSNFILELEDNSKNSHIKEVTIIEYNF